MKCDPEAIKHLNKILANELVAINQYFLHAKMIENWGFLSLAKLVKQESIDEMIHADKLADRILNLEGLPNFQNLGKLNIGQDVKETFEADLALEQRAIPDLKEAIAYLEKTQDYVSRDLLASILAEEEQHEEWIETQLTLIDKVGLQNYLQTQI